MFNSPELPFTPYNQTVMLSLAADLFWLDNCFYLLERKVVIPMPNKDGKGPKGQGPKDGSGGGKGEGKGTNKPAGPKKGGEKGGC